MIDAAADDDDDEEALLYSIFQVSQPAVTLISRFC
jgi:hypothetical protein